MQPALKSDTGGPSKAAALTAGVNLYDMAGDSTWPIVLVSYLYVKKDQSATNPKTAAALQADWSVQSLRLEGTNIS